MVGHDQGSGPSGQMMHRSTQSGQAELSSQQVLGCNTPDRQQYTGLHELDLALQVRLAVSHLIQVRVPIVGRAALQHVGDKHLAPCQTQRQQHAIQQLPCPANERFSLPILIGTRGFAHDHPLCLPVTHSENGLGARTVQIAQGAAHNPLAQRLPIERPDTVSWPPAVLVLDSGRFNIGASRRMISNTPYPAIDSHCLKVAMLQRACAHVTSFHPLSCLGKPRHEPLHITHLRIGFYLTLRDAVERVDV